MLDGKEAAEAILAQLETVVLGKRPVLKLVLVCLLADGHLLLEDVPGTAKTTLAKALGRLVGGRFQRVQCTPDLLPSDITGCSVFNQKTSDFEFRAGPVFANILLADEINRATPRSQAALLECMAEHQVTVDTRTYSLKRPFLVMATQNPVEHEGTFPLPEAQVDRFLMRLSLGYPHRQAEEQMLAQGNEARPLDKLSQVIEVDELARIQDLVRDVYVHPEVRRYMVDVVASTRSCSQLLLGASPRATQGLYRASQALAVISGREFVLPDDVKHLYPSILYHRVVMSIDARLARRNGQQVVDQAVTSVPVPIVRVSEAVGAAPTRRERS